MVKWAKEEVTHLSIKLQSMFELTAKSICRAACANPPSKDLKIDELVTALHEQQKQMNELIHVIKPALSPGNDRNYSTW